MVGLGSGIMGTALGGPGGFIPGAKYGWNKYKSIQKRSPWFYRSITGSNPGKITGSNPGTRLGSNPGPSKPGKAIMNFKHLVKRKFEGYRAKKYIRRY